MRQEMRRGERDDRRWDRGWNRDFGRADLWGHSRDWRSRGFPSFEGRWRDRDFRPDRFDRDNYFWARYSYGDRNYYPRFAMVAEYFPIVTYSSPVYLSYDPYYAGYDPYYVSHDPYYPWYAPYHVAYDPYYVSDPWFYRPVEYYDFGFGEPFYYDDDYDDYYYASDDYYDYPDGYYVVDSERDGLLRTILSIVFGVPVGGRYYEPSYADYEPAYYYDSYPAVAYSPVYSNTYPQYGAPYDDAFYGDGYTRELVRQGVATGYCQGFIDGQNARRYGVSDYYDPYGYDGDPFDNYSVSFSERQRLLSEGYEMGYRDAMDDRDVYGIDDYGASPDLVNVMLGNVLLTG